MSFLGIGLCDRARVDDLKLQRRFFSVVVRGEIGIIRLEGYVEISIFLRLGLRDGSGDLNGYGSLIRAGDDLEAVNVGSRPGKVVVNVRPDLSLQRLIVLRRAVRRDTLLEVGRHGSHKRRPVAEGRFTRGGDRIHPGLGLRPDSGRRRNSGRLSLNLLQNRFQSSDLLFELRLQLECCLRVLSNSTGSRNLPGEETPLLSARHAWERVAIRREVQGSIRTLCVLLEQRSEERRVGKECRSRWSPYH